MDDDATSEASVADLSRFIPKMPSTSSSGPHVISIGQLLESVPTPFYASRSLIVDRSKHIRPCFVIILKKYAFLSSGA